MAIEFSEVVNLIISLLPIIVILMVFKWIVKMFSEMDFDSDYSWFSSRNNKCRVCGDPLTEQDRFCGNCGSSR